MAIRAVRFVQVTNSPSPMLATGSWDKTVRYWDRRNTGSPVATLAFKDRVYAMDTAKSLLVIGTADREVHLVNLTNPTTIERTSPSGLKQQTRAVAAFHEGDGYAIGSIEGRCGFRLAKGSEK